MSLTPGFERSWGEHFRSKDIFIKTICHKKNVTGIPYNLASRTIDARSALQVWFYSYKYINVCVYVNVVEHIRTYISKLRYCYLYLCTGWFVRWWVWTWTWGWESIQDESTAASWVWGNGSSTFGQTMSRWPITWSREESQGKRDILILMINTF